jgi:hypothetical protein
MSSRSAGRDDQLVIALAGFAQLAVQQLEQAVLRLAPTQALQQLGAEFASCAGVANAWNR